MSYQLQLTKRTSDRKRETESKRVWDREKQVNKQHSQTLTSINSVSKSKVWTFTCICQSSCSEAWSWRRLLWIGAWTTSGTITSEKTFLAWQTVCTKTVFVFTHTYDHYAGRRSMFVGSKYDEVTSRTIKHSSMMLYLWVVLMAWL